ncbi:MAG: rRNA methyltransferase [Verrucomicrobia bacterium]|nr:rRNA methyltransferase [Verrucomicrobiota bacterium]
MTGIPSELKEKIEALSERVSLGKLVPIHERVSKRYREGRGEKNLEPFSNDAQRLSYAIARMPATYAALCAVFSTSLKNFLPSTLLDVGAGPGTALWAAATHLPSISHATCLEWDLGFIRLGKELAPDLPSEWIHTAMQDAAIEKHDLVVASYSLGELSKEALSESVKKYWELANQVFIAVEPGTPEGFRRILDVREQLIGLGGHLIAPCPHMRRCPSSWCHFFARAERTSLHRRLKGGSLNYEDEKFSYVAFSKTAHRPVEKRIVRHPFKGSGFIKFQVCSQKDLEEIVITKKNKDEYNKAKKLEWGDSF